MSEKKYENEKACVEEEEEEALCTLVCVCWEGRGGVPSLCMAVVV